MAEAKSHDDTEDTSNAERPSRTIITKSPNGHLGAGPVLKEQPLRMRLESYGQSRNKQGVPWFPHPIEGQFPVVSPARQAPFQRAPPFDPDHRLHETSVKVPVKAPRPEGKNADAPPVSWQISKL